jgi:hypothetical protein
LDPKEIKDIKAIIELMEKNDLSVFEIEKEGFRLKLQKGPYRSAGSGCASGGYCPVQSGSRWSRDYPCHP